MQKRDEAAKFFFFFKVNVYLIACIPFLQAANPQTLTRFDTVSVLPLPCYIVSKQLRLVGSYVSREHVLVIVKKRTDIQCMSTPTS